MTTLSPSPVEIDQAAKEYRELEQKYKTAKAASIEAENQLEIKAELLKGMVAKFGGPHATKAKILHGAAFELMCSYGQYSSIDPVAVENLRATLVKTKQRRILNKLLEKTVRWTLRSESSVMMRASELSTKIAGMLAKCIVLKDRNPSLTVREKAL